MFLSTSINVFIYTRPHKLCSFFTPSCINKGFVVVVVVVGRGRLYHVGFKSSGRARERFAHCMFVRID